MALRFYATGAFLGNIAREESFVRSKHAISEALHAVSLAITMNLARKYLQFPSTPEEKLEICDATRRILFLNARHPGSCHDASVWAASQLCREAPTIFEDGEWLIGDSAYPLQPWLMTPVRTPTTQEEEDYNDTHSRTRVRIEHCFGMLKMRFRCLQRYRTLHFAPDRSCNIINACVVLHNMCIAYNTPQLPDAGDAESGPDDDMTEEAHVAGADDVEDNGSAVATSSRATQGPQTPERAV
ncbi:putative nuclease HARBI1 [Ornithodoros turicata]|uniref:putative nuclease HARBI1 n=1 Tax=Ornithodoros turicata TaxID=34597 RepID=UPI0031396BB5